MNKPDMNPIPAGTTTQEMAKALKPLCNECGGEHEPSGARSDCIEFWKRRAVTAIKLVEWAQPLLSNATPNEKLLDDSQARAWCENFGKWFAESNQMPSLSHDWGSAKFIYDWLKAGTYRVVMHRHDDCFRAVDESEHKRVDASTLPLLCDALIDWDEVQPYPY